MLNANHTVAHHPRDIDRLLLSHGKLNGFRVSGKAWIFSSTVHVDPPWDDSKDLVEIARGASKEEEGARELPDAIEYLTVHCDISLPILGSPLEAQKVPEAHWHRRFLCVDFSKLPTQALAV